jgi:type IV secretory pathway VirB3-like protein
LLRLISPFVPVVVVWSLHPVIPFIYVFFFSTTNTICLTNTSLFSAVVSFIFRCCRKQCATSD